MSREGQGQTEKVSIRLPPVILEIGQSQAVALMMQTAVIKVKTKERQSTSRLLTPRTYPSTTIDRLGKHP